MSDRDVARRTIEPPNQVSGNSLIEKYNSISPLPAVAPQTRCANSNIWDAVPVDVSRCRKSTSEQIAVVKPFDSSNESSRSSRDDPNVTGTETTKNPRTTNRVVRHAISIYVSQRLDGRTQHVLRFANNRMNDLERPAVEGKCSSDTKGWETKDEVSNAISVQVSQGCGCLRLKRELMNDLKTTSAHDPGTDTGTQSKISNAVTGHIPYATDMFPYKIIRLSQPLMEILTGLTARPEKGKSFIRTDV